MNETMNEIEKVITELLTVFKKLSPDAKEEVILAAESLKDGKKMADALRMIADNEADTQTKSPADAPTSNRAALIPTTEN